MLTCSGVLQGDTNVLFLQVSMLNPCLPNAIAAHHWSAAACLPCRNVLPTPPGQQPLHPCGSKIKPPCQAHACPLGY